LCIDGHNNSGQAHGDGPNTHGQIQAPTDQKASSNGDCHKLITGRPHEVLNHLFIRSPGQLNCSHDIAGVAAHQHYSGRLNGDVSARADRDSDVCGCQGRRVIHAIPDHRDLGAICLKSLYRGCFVSGKDLGRNPVDPNIMGHRIGHSLGISRDHRYLETKLMEILNGFPGLRPNLILECKRAEQTPILQAVCQMTFQETKVKRRFNKLASVEMRTRADLRTL